MGKDTKALGAQLFTTAAITLLRARLSALFVSALLCVNAIKREIKKQFLLKRFSNALTYVGNGEIKYGQTDGQTHKRTQRLCKVHNCGRTLTRTQLAPCKSFAAGLL